MSAFTCEKCGTDIIDSGIGYITSCEHYTMEKVTVSASVFKRLVTDLEKIKIDKNSRL